MTPVLDVNGVTAIDYTFDRPSPRQMSISGDYTARTLTIIGCGALGTAILSGILCSQPSNSSASNVIGSDKSTFPIRFLACVRRDAAVKAVKQRLGSQASDPRVEILNSQNLHAVQQSGIVLLACQPHELRPFLDETGMRSALADKLIISVLAGVTTQQIQSHLTIEDVPTVPPRYPVIKVMPNTACFVRDSATVIERPSKPVPQSFLDLTDQIFRCVGNVFYTDQSQMDTCTALCGSTPAFYAVVVDAIVDGAVALGLNRSEAEQMAAHAMRGAANLVISGQQPHNVRNDVASPGGSTMQGLLALEDGRARSVFSNAMHMSATGATRLAAYGNKH